LFTRHQSILPVSHFESFGFHLLPVLYLTRGFAH